MKQDSLTLSDFRELSQFIYDQVGIHLHEGKKTLLETRIRKRITQLNLGSYREYHAYLFSPEGMKTELEQFINAVTTNKTDFFRENGHFDFLTKIALPELLKKRTSLRFWSAACSRGHEPYTLAMVLEEYRRVHPTDRLTYDILATDIDTSVLNTAKRAIYPREEVIPVPDALQKRYLLRAKDPHNRDVRIVPELRSKISFQQLNLMSRFKFATPIDIIFCRNVIIYFDRETQHRLIMRLLDSLSDDGYLLMGHSEVLDTREFPIESIAPAVYRKRIER